LLSAGAGDRQHGDWRRSRTHQHRGGLARPLNRDMTDPVICHRLTRKGLR
jgi:hypothetical protein